MADPITFTTEAERLKAREQHLEMMQTIFPSAVKQLTEVWEIDFDRAFPSIAPPKMVPWEAWVLVDANGKSRGHLRRMRHLVAERCATGERVARVRVVEVDDE